ncbi:uncharacterized protein LOC123543052 [Mercenaria mercenaria]|uniref:uncharacterized protein LOC123543052 n=1 Tax=Mercenaria mercenaria TaxID=6596 RepID=UPI00234F4879|nr:uncharacterized protein LOC123543052 [Mercenaria mercenaria]
MATPTSIIKSTQKKRHYCCVCSNFRGKVVDGRTIVLHRFPADINLRRTWIKRVKTVMKKFTFNNNARLCSAHFVDGQMSEKHNVPSVFEFPTKRKLFALSSVSSHQDTTEDDEIFFATPQNTMPRKFQSAYPSTRVIIDCTEFFTETPQSLINKSLMYSHYKSHMTYKALLGISPSGLITFVSDMWAGGISDKQITRSCGILDLCERGDAIMADKGFLISDLTTPRGLHLIIPPLKHKRFSRREVEETRRIANLRIYVEMAMERVKNFRILQGTIPITISKQLTQILKLCAGLSNLQPPLVLDD